MPTVTIRPSRRSFDTEGNETLLESALRAGLALDYGCSNGNCGLCKAKVLHGDTETVRHFDYTIPAAEKSAGFVLMCSTAARTNIELEADEAGSSDDIPWQSIETKVKKVEPVTDSITLLNLQTPRTNRLRFLAGQNAFLTLTDATTMELPIASCPCDDRNLQFHLKRRNAEVNFACISKGDVVRVEGPNGNFLLNETSKRPLVFLAYGTGIAPIKSLIEHALSLNNDRRISLYWLACDQTGHYLNNLMRAWDDAFENFHFHTVISEIPNFDSIKEILPNNSDYQMTINENDVYGAGPREFIMAVKDLLDENSHPQSQRRLQIVE